MPVNLTQIVGPIHVIADKTPDIIEYGVRWVVGQSNSVGERLKRVNGELFVGAATNLVANIGIDDQVVENSFDRIPLFITKDIIDNGNWMVKRRLYFHNHYFAKEGGVEYEYSWVCDKQLDGYIRPDIFFNNYGAPVDIALLSKYEASEGADSVARSIPGVTPWGSQTRNNARRWARKNDGDGYNVNSKWGIKDVPGYYYNIIVPWEIEFATRHSQSQMQGVVSLPYDASHVLLTSGTGLEVVITNAQASQYRLEQTISVGTSLGNYSVARNRYVKEINLDTPEAGQATLVLIGEPFTFTAGNNIFSFAWRSGFTDNIRASSGCYKANDGKHPIMFRGYENPWGNMFKFVDGVKILDFRAWVCKDRSAYNDTAPVNEVYDSNFTPLSYINASGSNDYIKTLGYDKNFPYARFPVEVGGTSSTYYADTYYQDVGARTVSVGGNWNSGGGAGLFCWLCFYSLANSSSNIGFRLSKYPDKGEY